MKAMRRTEYDIPYDVASLFEQGLDRRLPGFVSASPGLMLNLGAGRKNIGGAMPLDAPDWWAGHPFPCEDQSVGAIYAYHFFEHLEQFELISVLRECERVLTHGSPLTVVVPHFMSDLAHEDVDHKRTFAEETLPKLFGVDYYDGSVSHQWQFKMGLNVLMGLNHRNLCILQQIIKR